LIAVAVSIPESSVVARALATFVFLLLTAPIAAHVIARSAYYTGKAELWEQTCVDELADDIRQRPDPTPSDAPPQDPSAARVG
jgi:multicomponent Na+:H+ antiporter subunit G